VDVLVVDQGEVDAACVAGCGGAVAFGWLDRLDGFPAFGFGRLGAFTTLDCVDGFACVERVDDLADALFERVLRRGCASCISSSPSSSSQSVDLDCFVEALLLADREPVVRGLDSSESRISSSSSSSPSSSSGPDALSDFAGR